MRTVKRQVGEKLIDVIPRKNGRNNDGVGESVDMDDLVDIVLLAAESVNKNKAGDSGKREHSRRAACRYREKRKERWLKLQKERVEMERTNAKLKESIASLTKQIDDYKRKIFALLPPKNIAVASNNCGSGCSNVCT
ncbi:hypothetical protein V3C99_008812 [Haemonchus contortus]|uniref:BZIP domain-containing protein n=1 Tax=Haemonchus contortus TaxID=6289 RepID=A0A7I4YMM4_HAECO|nr:Basic leucine zipper domain containing protein [Haemonchus contortus]